MVCTYTFRVVQLYKEKLRASKSLSTCRKRERKSSSVLYGSCCVTCRYNRRQTYRRRWLDDWQTDRQTLRRSLGTKKATLLMHETELNERQILQTTSSVDLAIDSRLIWLCYTLIARLLLLSKQPICSLFNIYSWAGFALCCLPICLCARLPVCLSRRSWDSISFRAHLERKVHATCVFIPVTSRLANGPHRTDPRAKPHVYVSTGIS